MMVTSCRAARCSAISRQCPSEPPAISAPKRWMTHASFTARGPYPLKRDGPTLNAKAATLQIQPILLPGPPTQPLRWGGLATFARFAFDVRGGSRLGLGHSRHHVA